ncbi:hypothetical protein RvY_06672 [Ramazzottius varieornatus]|uniref:Uncharacterized protein n=1 Tax=Ramazzottius varieornatus TaxID=947166 RepID=A0A1D1V8Y0_RAMVA|nr:hypothetical protein RvY_06672 [Ramazzottius varieornatus]
MEKSGSAWVVYFMLMSHRSRGKPFPAIFLDQEIGKTAKEAYKSLEGKLKDAATDEALDSMGKSYAAAVLQPSNVQSDTAVNLPDSSITTVISHPHGQSTQSG